MTKPNTPGTDFFIPVVLQSGPGEESVQNLGPMFGKWDADDEERLSKYLAYIAIDSKNVFSMSRNEVKGTAEKCRPNTNNFAFHTPCNSYITLVPCYGVIPGTLNPPVEILPSPSSQLSGVKPLQLKIIIRGISGDAYKVFHHQPETQRMIEQLLQIKFDVLRDLEDDPVRRGMIDCLALQTDPGLEYNFRTTVNDTVLH